MVDICKILLFQMLQQHLKYFSLTQVLKAIHYLAIEVSDPGVTWLTSCVCPHIAAHKNDSPSLFAKKDNLYFPVCACEEKIKHSAYT